MGYRLLLADDSITIQKVVGIIFANEEYELTVVDNGTAALEKAREMRPDVMLVDALMPGKTGYEVCAEVRRDPALAATPLLLLIGAFDPVDEEKAKECGADSSITKPFESQHLIDRVKELLELGQNRKSAPAPKPAAAPAAAAPVAADDIWGDLAAETVPPRAPAAPARPAAPAAPAAPAPVFEEEVVEGSVEDDLWGAFELEEEVPPEVSPAPQAAPSAPARPAPLEPAAAPIEPSFAAPEAAAPEDAFGVVAPESEYEVEQYFTFEEDAEIEETQPLGDFGAVDDSVQPLEEEAFTFETTAQATTAPEPEPFSLVEEEAFEPIAEPAYPAVKPFAFEAQEAPEPARAPQGAAAQATFSEADLAAAISRISRDVIERIVWEVVPDLAETLIKEEIQKLKAGMKG